MMVFHELNHLKTTHFLGVPHGGVHPWLSESAAAGHVVVRTGQLPLHGLEALLPADLEHLSGNEVGNDGIKIVISWDFIVISWDFIVISWDFIVISWDFIVISWDFIVISWDIIVIQWDFK